jgi:hypothetical protein
MITDYTKTQRSARALQSTVTHQTKNKTDRKRGENSLGGILSNVIVSIFL